MVAEVQNLRANKTAMASGVVIEAKLDKGKGPVATLLVQNGTLHTGDCFVVGSVAGRVRALISDSGERIKEAGYIPMVYSNKKTAVWKYDLSRLQDYDFWLAEYSDKPSYYYNYTMWQYTYEGKVSGIEGGVDMNISFVNYADRE